MTYSRHFEFLTELNINNTAAGSGRFIEFYRNIKTTIRKRQCAKNRDGSKFKMAAAAILKFALTAISRSLLHIFAQNLATD